MNFQKIVPVENSKFLLDLAFRKARQKGKQKNLKGNWLQIIRQKEALKLDIVKDTIVPRLQKIIEDFPNEEHLPLFYIRLFKLTLDYPQLKKSYGAVGWALKRVRLLQKSYVSKIIKCKDRNEIKALSKEFYGRLASTLKQVDENFDYLEKARKRMRSFPDIKDLFTVCVYGFPNAGKTTLLNKLTGAKAEVAEYAFTTKSVNSGFFETGGKKIQVLDVPGTLARKDKMNDVEMQAELVLEELADAVIYVFDLSEFCGYTLEMQEELLKHLAGKMNVLIYLSKTDLFDLNNIDFAHVHYTVEELKDKIVSLSEGWVSAKEKREAEKLEAEKSGALEPEPETPDVVLRESDNFSFED